MSLETRVTGDFITVHDEQGLEIGRALRGYGPDGPATNDVIAALQGAVARGEHHYGEESK